MGTNFYITPREDIDPNYESVSKKFPFYPDQFAEALKAKWKNTEIGTSYSEHFDMRWECEVNHRHKLYGSLFHNSCGVVLEKPDINDVVDFAVWFRAIVPYQIKLAIYNDSDVTPFEIKMDTTYLQIVDFFAQYDYWITVTLQSIKNTQIDIEKLPSQLRNQWSQVEIFPITDVDPYAFYWEVNLPVEFTHHINISETEFGISKRTQDVIQTGAIRKNRSEICLNIFPYTELAKVLTWYRSIVDESIELWVERREDHRHLKLWSETSTQEIIDTFRRDWEMGM